MQSLFIYVWKLEKVQDCLIFLSPIFMGRDLGMVFVVYCCVRLVRFRCLIITIGGGSLWNAFWSFLCLCWLALFRNWISLHCLCKGNQLISCRFIEILIEWLIKSAAEINLAILYSIYRNKFDRWNNFNLSPTKMQFVISIDFYN